MNLLQIPSPIQEINSSILKESQLRLWVKREDLIHPEISGNKWRKLKYNLRFMSETHKKGILTFGGAFSNHIYATAAAGKGFNFSTIGVIRGEEVDNATLSYAKSVGMQLEFVSRSLYRDKAALVELYREKYPDYHILPEGGTNEYALPGCAEIAEEIKEQLPVIPDYIALAVGTAGTMSGLLTGLKGVSKVIGVSALKGDFHSKEIQSLLDKSNHGHLKNWDIWTKHHFGGYAKIKPPLIDFIQTFYQTHKIPLEPIYTGKLFYAIFDQIAEGYFPKGSNILLLHTGGLQGLAGIEQRYGISLAP